MVRERVSVLPTDTTLCVWPQKHTLVQGNVAKLVSLNETEQTFLIMSVLLVLTLYLPMKIVESTTKEN